MARLNLWHVDRPQFAFDAWNDFGREFERIFQDFNRLAAPVRSKPAELRYQQPHLHVPVQVDENEAAYVLSLDVPGVSKDDIEIEINGKQLLIRGERRSRSEKPEGAHTVSRYGKFERVFTLPEGVDSDAIAAHCEHGVLHLSIPKAASTKPRRIKIAEDGGGFFKKLLGKDQEKINATSDDRKIEAK